MTDHANICDKLGNPIDALDSFIQFEIKEKGESENLKQCNELIENIKTIFNDFRSADFYNEEDLRKAIQMGVLIHYQVTKDLSPDKYGINHIEIPKKI